MSQSVALLFWGAFELLRLFRHLGLVPLAQLHQAFNCGGEKLYAPLVFHEPPWGLFLDQSLDLFNGYARAVIRRPGTDGRRQVIEIFLDSFKITEPFVFVGRENHCYWLTPPQQNNAFKFARHQPLHPIWEFFFRVC